MTITLVALQVVALLIAPFAVVGAINRTKSLWAGRRGPPILQLVYDVVRLLKKRPVYSTTTTYVFRLGPWVVLATSFVSGLIAPFLGARAPLAFPFDFVWFAYVWGLGRIALMLGALDTGSSFEGMGASREATFAAVLEPAFFLVAGAACLVTRERSFGALLALHATDGVGLAVWLGSVVALFILVQVESARMPVDDPTTHLELTMVGGGHHNLEQKFIGSFTTMHCEFAARIDRTVEDSGGAAVVPLLQPGRAHLPHVRAGRDRTVYRRRLVFRRVDDGNKIGGRKTTARDL